MRLKVIFDAREPRDEVLRGDLRDEMFAARLRDVIEGRAMLNAMPRTKEKGKFVRPEAEVLEAMRPAFFDDLVPPVEEGPRIAPEQLAMAETVAPYGEAGETDEEPEDEDEDDE